MTTRLEKITPHNYQLAYSRSNQPHHLVDVRSFAEFAEEHIQGAVHIPLEGLVDSVQTLPDNKPLILYCRSGYRSAMAQQLLIDRGFRPVYNLGGINAWKAAGFATQSVL